MLKNARIILASLFFIGITLLFVGIGGGCWGWMAKCQFLPSLFALNGTMLIGILLLTFIFGRVYCSVICPMGVFQDIVIFLRRSLGKMANKQRAKKLSQLKEKGVDSKKKPTTCLKRFDYVKEHKWVRYPVLVVSALSVIFLGQLLISLIAPYSAYGRIVRSIAGLAEGDSILPILLLTAVVTFLVISVCAWIWGREYCNTICPVGTTLSLFSRFSLFRPVIDADKCTGCRRCFHNCKASCIDGEHHRIDYSRCIDCFDCITNCNSGAIKYKFVGLRPSNLEHKAKDKADDEKVDSGRRAFLGTTAFIGAGLIAQAQNKRLDGGLAEVIDKKNPERSERLVPAGAQSVKHFYDHCTACQLCVSACPNNVLRPSSDIEHFLQPLMGYEHGYCRPECTECSQICPSGAILPIAREEKHLISIGTAKVNYELCFAAKGEASCGNCSRHCPSGAIRMVYNASFGAAVPIVAEEQCLGCGACENLCPARPISAITVNGNSVHHNNN